MSNKPRFGSKAEEEATWECALKFLPEVQYWTERKGFTPRLHSLSMRTGKREKYISDWLWMLKDRGLIEMIEHPTKKNIMRYRAITAAKAQEDVRVHGKDEVVGSRPTGGSKENK
jgi:hypothetical protein